MIFILICLASWSCKPSDKPIEVFGTAIGAQEDTISSNPALNPKTYTLEKFGELPPALTECSGLVALEDDWYAGNNDSGNDARLYMFNLRNKDTKAIRVENARNHDWEELTEDTDYIYISDTGNNAGNRDDLCVYRVNKHDVKNGKAVPAEKIAFTYDLQKNFNPNNKHNFDCESIISVGDSLYLFSKNRGNQKTDVYRIPKVPGSYTAQHLGEYNADGLVTSAAWSEENNRRQLVLIGYKNKGSKYNAFLIHFPNISGTDFFKTPGKRVNFNTNLQIESVLFHDWNTVYITNEEEHGQEGLMYKVEIE